MKAQKRPVKIDFIDSLDPDAIAIWMKTEFMEEFEHHFTENDGKLQVLTLEGTSYDVTTDDVIIRGVDGEYYPCKKNIFNKTYDVVSDEIKLLKNAKTQIISGFPGIGKSVLYQNQQTLGLVVLDSDSSKFDKADFPNNYIQHIIESIGKVDIILVSSHKDVRDALLANGLDFTLIYPAIELKDEYLQRYKERENTQSFIDLITNNWEAWINGIKLEKGYTRIELNSGEFLVNKLWKLQTQPFGCLMIDLKPVKVDWTDLLNIIDPVDIKELEMDPHVTIIYGLDKLSNSELRVMNSLINNISIPGYINGELSVFANDECDVLIYKVDNKYLNACNELISTNFNYETSFPDYQAHVTLAYLKPGLFDKYKELLPQNLQFAQSGVTYSHGHNDIIKI